MELEGYLTVMQYAEREGITKQAVYYRIEKGLVESVKIGKIILIKE
jgi:hypothetical protein